MAEKEDRGFRKMSPENHRLIASKGGKAAHEKKVAHEWTVDEAREAGRKGASAGWKKKREAAQREAEVEAKTNGVNHGN